MYEGTHSPSEESNPGAYLTPERSDTTKRYPDANIKV